MGLTVAVGGQHQSNTRCGHSGELLEVMGPEPHLKLWVQIKLAIIILDCSSVLGCLETLAYH